MVKVGCVITTFNPSYDLLRKNLLNVVPQTALTVVVDNGSSAPDAVRHACLGLEVKTIFNSRNLGIGTALNIGVQFLLNTIPLDFVLTLDQDTIIPIYSVNTIFTDLCKSKYSGIGIIAYSTILDKLNAENFVEIEDSMTSGSFVNCELFKKISYREDFFVDWIDLDFFISVRNVGYRIIRHNTIMDHNNGIQYVPKSRALKLMLKFAGLRVTTTEVVIHYHSPYRFYYIVRNLTVLLKEGKISFSRYVTTLSAPAFFFNSLIAHKIIPTLHYSLLGFIHGLCGKMGEMDRG